MKKFLLLAVLFSALVPLAQTLDPARKIASVEKIIETFYVDPVDTTKVVDEGIRAMLKKLDPHSSYTNAEETKEVTEPLEGKFSGIGIQFQMLNDTLYVIQTIAGGPSERVGIQPGDRILVSNDSLISGVKRPNSSVMKLLRGPKGTVANLKVLRGKETIDFRVVRDDIPIYSVDASYMVDPEIGYIRLSRFAEETPEEMYKAIEKLNKQGMKKLIIDLQDNSGGYLQSATTLAEMLLPFDAPIVSTGSDRLGRSTYTAAAPSTLFDGPVQILVNQFSASASEILAGAVQDNDRGIIVGRRTFGKGLVQRPFPFPDGSMVRLTVARYYTPSGRCIQKPYHDGDDDAYRDDLINRYKHGEYLSEDSIVLPDSLKYYTLKLHRPVYGGGGILPDKFVPIDTTGYSTYYRDLMAKGVYNRIVTNYIDANRKQLKKTYKNVGDFISGFEISQKLIDDMVKLGEDEGVPFDEKGFETSKETILTILKGLVARDLFDQEAYWRVANRLDPVYLKAIEIFSTPGAYEAALSHQ